MTIKTGTTRPLSPNQQIVMDYITQAGKPVGREDVMTHCQIPLGSVDNCIGKLRQRDRIISVGSAKQMGRTDLSPRSAMYALPGTPSLLATAMGSAQHRVKPPRYTGAVGNKYVPEFKPSSGREFWLARDLALLTR